MLEKDFLKKHQVLIGGILKRYKDDATYLVKVKIPGERERERERERESHHFKKSNSKYYR